MSNLLQKASILLTPTAYNDGSMLSVKPENGDGDFTFSRGSAATRVNAQGLVENVQIISSELVSNGNFSQEGSELITNGSFATDSNWTLSSGITYNSNGYIDFDGTQGTGQVRNTPNITFVQGKTYKVVYEIKNYVSGTIKFRFQSGANTIGAQQSGDGVKTEYIVCNDSSNNNFQFFNSPNFIGSIDNASVKEVGQDWTFGTGWSLDQANSKATFDGGADSNLTSSLNVINSTKYRYKFDVSDMTAGSLSLRLGAGNVNDLSVTSNGTYEGVTTSEGTQLLFRSNSGFNGSITNVSVKEITDDTDLPRIDYEGFSYQDSLGSELITNGSFDTDTSWNKDNGWSIQNGYAESTALSTRSIYQNIGNAVVDKKYKITYTILETNGGNFRLAYGGVNGIIRNSVGTYTEIITATSSSDANVYFDALNVMIGKIDNVSVKEYLGQEVVPDSGCGSWLLEPQRTNSLLQSNQFDTTWTTTNSSVASGQTGVGGSSDAWLLECTTTASSARITQVVSLSGDLSYSFYAKKGTTDSINLRSNDSGTATWFNLSSGVVHSTGSNASNAQIKDAGDGWYKCSVVFNSCTSVRIYLSDGVGSYIVTNGANVYIQYSQLELGGYPTSYIPTNGATNTRLQDIANNSGNSTLINSTEGVLYAEIAALADDGNVRMLSISDGSTNNSVSVEYSVLNNLIRIRLRSGNVEQSFYQSTNYDFLQYHKIALSYKLNDFKLYIDGVLIHTDTSLNTPVNLSELSFSNGTGGNKFYGKAKAVAVYKEALTDAQLQSLTTI